MTRVLTVDFFYGLGSRYSYLAFTQIARFEAEFGCRFALHPVSSIELIRMRGPSPFDGTPVSGQYEWSYRQRDAEAWAAFYGVPYVEPIRLPEDHRLMARACHAAGLQGAVREFSEALFKAVFVEGAIVDPPRCHALAADLGLDGDRYEADLEGPEVDRRATAAARDAFGRGAFGVPTFFFGGAMYWGNDRLALLGHALAGQRPS